MPEVKHHSLSTEGFTPVEDIKLERDQVQVRTLLSLALFQLNTLKALRPLPKASNWRRPIIPHLQNKNKYINIEKIDLITRHHEN